MEKPEEFRPQSLRQAKILAALKIVEWSRDSVEPGIGGNPPEMHVTLALAFQKAYQMVSEVVDAESESNVSS